MHNSQDDSPIDAGGTNDQLLTSGCVGCHSAADSTTWKDGVTGAPIVWNQSVPSFNAQKGLAGGNFYWVGAGDNTKGHNVYGISGADTLSEAPGFNMSACGSNSCHMSLATPPDSTPMTGNAGRGGCQGCHVYVAHHDDSKPWYRFLKGHNAGNNYVIGDEDPDWEFSTIGDSHNYYKGENGPVSSLTTLSDTNSMSSFCGGCHIKFHRQSDIESSSLWIRHPTDIELPQGDGSEYAAYDPVNNYSVEAPVAWTDPTNIANRGTPIVMCLSCHRAHGSDQPDMLRWDYSTMATGTAGAAAGTGCFICHTTKDGI